MLCAANLSTTPAQSPFSVKTRLMSNTLALAILIVKMKTKKKRRGSGKEEEQKTCSSCSQCSTQPVSLSNTMATPAKNNQLLSIMPVYICDYCDFRCFATDDLLRHIRRCHENNPSFLVYCHLCGLSFKKWETLRKHYSAESQECYYRR